jgi:hypothetical protein
LRQGVSWLGVVEEYFAAWRRIYTDLRNCCRSLLDRPRCTSGSLYPEAPASLTPSRAQSGQMPRSLCRKRGGVYNEPAEDEGVGCGPRRMGRRWAGAPRLAIQFQGQGGVGRRKPPGLWFPRVAARRQSARCSMRRKPEGACGRRRRP